MDERFLPYDNLLIDVMMIPDPQYLSRPYIYSKMYVRVPQGAMAPYQCNPNDETPRPEGLGPMHLAGNQVVDGPVSHGIPLKAALGGAETMFPEYQDTLKSMPRNPPLAQVRRRPVSVPWLIEARIHSRR